MEFRFSVRLESYAIRTASGGAGRWHGGDAGVRRVRFLEPDGQHPEQRPRRAGLRHGRRAARSAVSCRQTRGAGGRSAA